MFDLIFPVLKIQGEERETFVDHEEEFYLFLEDLLFQRQSETLKVKTSNLLFQLVKSIEGYMSFVFNCSFTLIEGFSKGNPSQGQFSLLESLSEKSFLRVTSEPEISECCLKVFCLLNILIRERKDLMQAIKCLFTYYLDYFIFQKDVLLQSTFVFFVKTYLKHFCSPERELPSPCVVKIVGWVLNLTQSKDSLAYIASQHLSIIKESQISALEFTPFLSTYANQVAWQIEQTNYYPHSILFIDYFLDKYSGYLLENLDYCVYLLHQLKKGI